MHLNGVALVQGYAIIQCIYFSKKKIALISIWSFYFSGVRIVCSGHTVRGIRDDLFWRCECDLLTTIRYNHEVHRTIAVDDVGLRRSLDAHMDPSRVAASPQQSQAVLHHIGTLGCR